MDNQHQHKTITGDRDLDHQEIDLINKINAVGSTLDELIEEVEYANLSTGKRSALDEIAEPDLWAHQAKINLKIGLMALTRAVAKPMHF